MTSRGNSSLGWAERPMAELIRVAWPISVSMLSYSAMTLADTLFVSRLGSSALAGVGLGGTAAFLVLCFSFGMLRAVKILVSQAFGAGRSADARTVLGAGILLAIGLGLVSLGVAQVLAEALPALAATPAAGSAARTFLRIRMIGTPLVLVYVALRESRYGVGDARAPMRAAVAANVVNVLLAWLFVVVLGKGVAGAATATACAEIVQAGLLILTQSKEGFGLGRAALARVPAVFRLGVPTGVQFAIEMGSLAALTALVSAFGEMQMAAHQIVLQLLHFSFLPALAVSEAAGVLSGQAVGAGRDELVRVVGRRALAIASAYMVLCAVVLGGFGSSLVAPFAEDAGLRAVAVNLCLVAAGFQIFDGMNIVARGVLRGTGDVRFAAWTGVLSAWLLTPPLTWLLGGRLGMGALGGWLGMCAEVVVGAVILWTRLERGGWRPYAERARAQMRARATVPVEPLSPEVDVVAPSGG